MEYSGHVAKRQRNSIKVEDQPHEKMDSSHQYEASQMQVTHFGRNFVTCQEYQQLKVEHEKLKEEMEKIKQLIFTAPQAAAINRELDKVKKENKKLHTDIKSLKICLKSVANTKMLNNISQLETDAVLDSG